MIRKIKNTVKSLLGMQWLKSEISKVAAGTALGHGLGEYFTKLLNKNNLSAIVNESLQLPSQAELFLFFAKLNEEDRKFYEERLQEAADRSIKTPSLQEVTLALRSLLALKKQEIILRDQRGNPILDQQGTPLHITKPGLSEEELIKLFSQYAHGDKKSFWRWIEIILTDEQLQKLRKVSSQTKGEFLAGLAEQIKEWCKNKKEEIERKADESMKELEKQTEDNLEKLRKLKF